MKIAFLSDSIYPFNKGGKETRSYELATQLTKRGHEVHFYTMKFWKGQDRIKKEGIYFHGLCKNYPLYSKEKRSIKQGIIFGFAAFKLLKQDFDVLDADHMVYFHLFPAKLACLIKRKPLIVTWNEVWGKNYWKKYMGKKGILGYMAEKLASKLPNKIISISEHTTKNLIKKLKVKEEKIQTIPCSVDLKKIQKVKPAKEKSDVIFAGRLISHKNVNVLIRAIKIIKKIKPNVKCVIIGDGPEKQNLQDLAKQLGLEKNIRFKGIIPRAEDVHALIKSSKVFVLPSTREGFGISVIEANACGIPVVAVKHKDNAAKDLIQLGKNGFLCRLNEKQLAKTIVKAIKLQNLNKTIKKFCISSAEKYDWSRIIRKFEEVYGK